MKRQDYRLIIPGTGHMKEYVQENDLKIGISGEKVSTMKKNLFLLPSIMLILLASKQENTEIPKPVEAVVIDHTSIDLSDIPVEWIDKARRCLHIAYEHTSHGSQITVSMSGLANWKGDTYAWNKGGTGGALDLHDHAISPWKWSDLGNIRDPSLPFQESYDAWADLTRTYLDSHNGVNVVVWSWCGQVSYATEADIDTYLTAMNSLERDYPDVRFVYMTGHLDGTGLTGNLHLRNEQIRDFCRANKKILFDFADIETYDRDGIYYGDKYPTDGCSYDYDGDGVTEVTGDPDLPVDGDKNWALDWQDTHTVNVDWFNTPAGHTQPLNGNMKAYAAWHLWARIAGWDGN